MKDVTSMENVLSATLIRGFLAMVGASLAPQRRVRLATAMILSAVTNARLVIILTGLKNA